MKTFEQNYRWKVISEMWNAGERDLTKMAEAVIAHEQSNGLKLRSIKKERTVDYYTKIVRWFLITASKKNLITGFTFRKFTKKTATNEEAQQMVNSGEATIPTEAVVAPEVAIAETKVEEVVVTETKSEEAIVTL